MMPAYEAEDSLHDERRDCRSNRQDRDWGLGSSGMAAVYGRMLVAVMMLSRTTTTVAEGLVLAGEATQPTATMGAT